MMDPVLFLVIIGLIFLVISVVLWYVASSETTAPPPQRGQIPAAPSQLKKWSWAWAAGAIVSLIISIMILLYAVASKCKLLAQMFSSTPSFGQKSPTENCVLNGLSIVPTSCITLDPDDKVERFFVRAYSLWHNTVELKTKAGRYLRGHLFGVSDKPAMSFMIEESKEERWKQTQWIVQSSTRTLEECKVKMQEFNSLGSHYLAGVNDCRFFAALFGAFLSTI